MPDDDRPAFPAPRARPAEGDAPYRAPSAPPASPANPANPARVVHRPDAPPSDPRGAPTAPKPQLSKDEIRALLDVTAPPRPTRTWLWRWIAAPAGGVVWALRRLVPWPIFALAVVGWLLLVALEIRRFVRDGNRW